MTAMGDTREKPVFIRAKLKFPNVGSFVERYAPNVSTAGFFLKTPSPKAVGTRVKFELLVSDGTSVMRGLGEVSWVRETDEWPRAMGMGIKYLKIDDETQRMVARIMESKRSMGEAIPRSLYSEMPPPNLSVAIEADEPPAAPPPVAEKPQAAPQPAPPPTPAIVPPPAQPAEEHRDGRKRHRTRSPAVDLSAIGSMLADLAAPTSAASFSRRHGAPKEPAPAERQPVAAPEAAPVVKAAAERAPVAKAPVEKTAVKKALVEIAPDEETPDKEPAPRLTVSIVDSVANPAALTDLLEPGSEPPDPEPTYGEMISFMPPKPSASLDDAFASLIDSVPPDALDVDLGDPLEDEDGVMELSEDAVISEPQEEEELVLDVADGLLEEAIEEETAGADWAPAAGSEELDLDRDWMQDLLDDKPGK
jgi:uncharacterized protein (TIGR02266 family)